MVRRRTQKPELASVFGFALKPGEIKSPRQDAR
jgi:hypothetical protein